MSEVRPIEIMGQGLAGCCLAWHLHWAGAEFRVSERVMKGSASPVAAGLVNPVTGKNFEPSWRIGDFLPEAIGFYKKVGETIGRQLWFPLPVIRLVAEKDWRKVAGKLERPDVAPWVDEIEENFDGWRAAVTLRGGGRVDVAGFCAGKPWKIEDQGSDFGRRSGEMVRCEGAFALMKGEMGEHRCAKGEILTLKIPRGDDSRILVGGGGWLVPVGNGLFKAGSTYEWHELNGEPTETGRVRVGDILGKLGVSDYEVVDHQAGIRPIVRRSMPLIGRLPDGAAGFNGLGSKGSLYAPGVARRLAEWMLEGRQIEEELDVERWMQEGE